MVRGFTKTTSPRAACCGATSTSFVRGSGAWLAMVCQTKLSLMPQRALLRLILVSRCKRWRLRYKSCERAPTVRLPPLFTHTFTMWKEHKQFSMKAIM